jgi:dihydrofolate reductase
LERAKEAANGKDVRLGGGVSTMKQYLRAGLVDDMHFVLSPALIGSGERLFDDLNLPGAGYELKDHIASPGATHVMVARRK